MRSEKQMFTTVLSIAEADERIRAVILTGSRANHNSVKDDFQDFDIIYLVEDLASFAADQNWIAAFGERIITQLPNSMKIDEYDVEAAKDEITYLMLFQDFNRIDLKLVAVKNSTNCKDSLNKVLLDKDNLFAHMPPPSEKNYLIKQPSQKEFTDCCNEFWWVTTYVVKGLAREEPLYAKAMLEGPVRNMFMRMLAWSVGTETGFSVNIGKSNRFLRQYVSDEMWTSILKTYPDADLANIWNSLLEMIALFHKSGLQIADKLGLVYNKIEARNVQAYIRERRKTGMM